MIEVLIFVSALLVIIGAARLVVWYVAHLDRIAESRLRAAQLLADAELEANMQRLEAAWRFESAAAQAQEAQRRG